MSLTKKRLKNPLPVITGTYAGLRNIINFGYGVGAASYTIVLTFILLIHGQSMALQIR